MSEYLFAAVFSIKKLIRNISWVNIAKKIIVNKHQH